MKNWAILTGIEGNLAAYEAVLADIKRLRIRVDELYILGDLVGPNPDCEKLVQRVRSPKRGEIEPQICIGWWEEQCFNLHGIGSSPDATELREKYGADTIKLLWDSVSRKTVEWLRSLNFGFHELDCLLIHGSTVGASDELTPETPPPVMLDRVIRADANTLFCGRSGLAFEYQLQPSIINNWVQTLDSQEPPGTVSATARRAIGVGNVGRKPGVASYALYNPDSDRVQFKTVHYGGKKGFQL
ncbi:MAG: metallophosphatase family protein [Oscillatoriales cyanobacterium]|uniref:Metallophosphatase n=1 Tax=Microcoleus anatoxicus PTRS2 TaxID=2705321 RepID=A0ABU8YRC1_9CYAN|nr:MAG: metallophosphatase family protein [Oscillatoriales cyanobacterium]